MLTPGKAFIAAAAAILNGGRSGRGTDLHGTMSGVADDAGVICAGLSCLDLQLVGCTSQGSLEAIERYDEAVHCAGGSASMTGTTLALLLRGTEENVHVLTKVGPDFAGNTLLEFYKRAGASTRLVLTDDSARTSMAVLPIFKNGKRGCFVNLACNDGFTPDELLGQLDLLDVQESRTRAFLFGYPHLMPKMQGESMRSMLRSARKRLHPRALIGVDLNGVDGSDSAAARDALAPALGEIDVLHLNEDEVKVLSCSSSDKPAKEDEKAAIDTDAVDAEMLAQVETLHKQGCAVVLLSLGSKGALVSVTSDENRLQDMSPPISDWNPGEQVRVGAFKVEGDLNANGAGDALFSGFCLAASSWGGRCEVELTPRVAGVFASLVAWQRCDSRTRDGEGMRSASRLMEMIKEDDLPGVLQ